VAQKESVLLDALRLMRGNRNGWTVQMLDKDPAEHMFEDAVHVAKLRGELVLKYRPDDIEDTIYFMKHRGYIEVHGQGMAAPELVYSLTDKARMVADSGHLPSEEEAAFREALWDIKPKLWGMGPNLPEWLKRSRKLIEKRKR
jgi:hypothetical protein